MFSSTAPSSNNPIAWNPLFLQPPSASLLISVIIPVRNEVSGLIKTLHALRTQQKANGMPFGYDRYEVLLLANNCTDHTFQLATEYKQIYPDFPLLAAEIALPPQKANVGTARGLLMDEACRRFMQLGKSKGIIASTDGDTEADAWWMHHIIAEFEKGNDAVGGRIMVQQQEKDSCLYHSLDETYRNLVARVESILDPLEYDPWPRHYQYFGASLAVTCEMYQQAGRLPQLPYLEDEAFYRALVRRDARIRKSPSVKVHTSGRQNGRVQVGLSEQLRKWSQMKDDKEQQLVVPAAEIIARLQCRRMVRLYWQEAADRGTVHAGKLETVAKKLSLSHAWLRSELEKSHFFGQLWESIEQQIASGHWAGQWKPEGINGAIGDLTEFVNRYQRTGA